MKYKNTCRLAGLSSAFLFLLSCSLKKINKDQNESGNANKTPIFFFNHYLENCCSCHHRNQDRFLEMK